MGSAPTAGGLQENVRRTRAQLERAETVGDLDGIRACIAALGKHADRAAVEARESGFADKAGPLIRALANDTASRWDIDGGEGPL